MPIFPLAGVNNVARDDDMVRAGDVPARFVRDAVNVDIHRDGRLSVRRGFAKVSDLPLRDVWQSPLHGDVFAACGGQWGRLERGTWSFAPLLAGIGVGRVYHAVVNNRVMMSCDAGLFVFDGVAVRRLTVDTPPPPLLLPAAGAMVSGAYAAAVSWLRDDGVESALSDAVRLDVADGGLSVLVPVCGDSAVVGVRVYLSKPDGGVLHRVGDFAPDVGQVDFVSPPQWGVAEDKRWLSPMPQGAFLQLWRGRLWTVRGNVLYYSQPLAWHLHDARYDFIQLPQRVSFLAGVDGGLWVGQSDHVVFLAGDSPDNLIPVRHAVRSPVAGSAATLPAQDGSRFGGGQAVLWLADNGLVVGTGDGRTVELQGGVLSGLAAEWGHTALWGGRVGVLVG